MIKQIKSSEIKRFIESNPNTILLDVRTEDEWNTVGKPDTKKELKDVYQFKKSPRELAIVFQSKMKNRE